MTSHHDVDVIVFDVLGTMVDEPTGIRRGLQALLPDIDDSRTHELLELWSTHVEEQHQEIRAGRRPYASSTVLPHAWDLRGAQAVGMRTAYVERPVGDPPSAKDSFDLQAESLADLAMILTA